TPSGPVCALCDGRRRVERQLLAEIRRVFPGLPVRALPALPDEPCGLGALRAVGALLRRGERALGSDGRRIPETPARRFTATTSRRPGSPFGRARRVVPGVPPDATTTAWTATLDALAPAGVRLLVVAGKGGVGKTTVAATLALALSRQRPQAR